MSDEADCASRCHHVINAEYGSTDTKPSGFIVNTNNYLNSRSCFWSIVTNIGSTIRVQVDTFNTEKNADVVEFRTGGREGEIFLAELTGKLAVNNQPVYYSSDNVFNIRLVTDNTFLQSGGFRISWTTDVPEVFNDVKMLTATTSVQHLKSPFYDTGNFPQEKVFEWKITADTNNVITLEFENLDIGKDSKLYLWDQDDISLDPTLDGVSAFKPKHYISKSKSIRLMLITGREEAPFPKGIYIKYWEGCSISYMSKEGTIQSPGFIGDSYPENVVCTWTIQRPTSETRTMALRFNMFDLQAEQDYLKIYNDTNEMLHTGEGFTGTTDLTNNFEVRSTNGYIKLVFTTNYVLTDKGFEAEFSLDCAELAVSEETHHISTSGYETSFMNTIEMSCADGYSFVNDGRSNVHFIKCEKGGEWNETRIPNCMITYCRIPPAVDNGKIVESSGVKVDNNVTYKCNDGFTMIGEPVIKCLQDGNWEVPPRCTAATCPDLITPENGGKETLVGDADGRDFASVVQYVCDPGYETYGNVTTYCQTGGKWSHDPPTCKKISCPMPRFQRGNLNPNDTLKFEAETTLTCDSGFGINGTETKTQVLTCESDGRLSPYVACLDVDECNGTIVSPSPCPDTEDCHNTIGSHMCTCKDGYERIGNAACSNINECSSNNGIGPCHQRCTDSSPGYTCGCNDGFVLYTAEGISNISLADGENGEKEGDVYYINHTCVRKQCPVPPPLTNGQVLSKKELFFFQDSVEFTCDHGYKLSTTNSKLDCQSGGSWSNSLPSCQMATCPTPTTGSIERSTNIYPAGPTVDYNKEVNIECQYGSKKMNRTLYCSYNVMNSEYELLGDAQECPEIDCGQPEEVPGSMYSGLTNTTLNSSFTFECNSGFERSGMSLDVNGIYTVSCQENGRWNIGNLTCTGGRCKDPGTPGGAMQVVTSYEVGQMVYFKCNSSGYFPEPPQPLECVVDTTTGNITWNATAEDGSADLPECLDKTAPVFSNCPSELIYVDKTEEYTYQVLTAMDNSGAVKNIHNPGGYWPSGLRTNSDIDITYTAEDFSGNKADCVIKIRVKDYAKHELTCPQNITRHIDTATGEIFNVSDVVSVTPSDSDLTFTFNPGELITLDHTAMAEQKKVVVTAIDKWGAEDQCSFFVETKADACFKESFPVSVSNAAPVTCTSSNISCTVTCNIGFVFFDGNTTKKYDCTGQNMWMPALPPDTCISITIVHS
ncbi:sushi, von Willebrand factor type A, EGF and pentraxin domain-containing protein 1-like [Mytilus trossulus]|uniref:sushi, von Willebrand factor type A, EGF and pentraxin domain-containing protein 1-like n=1 Tax=Mytilus trossulus TaxID=6551 RepID=UPI0030062795